MDYYSFERRHRRRRRHRSTSFHEIASDDSDDDIEQEIIDRAMEIERSREKSLRRQLEYIVHYVKKLERRRHERQRMRSVEHNVMSTSPSHRRNSDSHSHWDSSSERFYQTNDSSYAETRIRSRSKLRKMASYQITMNYRGIQSQRHGDEIMVLQENIIIFKGFLRPQETFTFKFKRHYRQLNVKLEFFINELCECCLTINCERKQINEQNEFFQLETIQSNESNEKFQTNDEEQLSSETEKSSPIDYCRRRRHHSNSLNAPTTNGRKRAQWHNGDYDRHKSKTQPHSLSLSISRDENNTSRENSYVKKISQNNPSPLQTLVTEQCQSAHEEITKNKQSKPSSTQASSKLASESSPRTISTNEKKATIRHIISSDNDDQNQTLQENVTKKASYGPPQLSTLGRSDSESISDELTNTLKQDDEKPSTDTIKRSESLSEKKRYK